MIILLGSTGYIGQEFKRQLEEMGEKSQKRARQVAQILDPGLKEDGAVSARPRDWCYGLTCVLASPGNRASTQLADAGDYAP